VPEVRFVDTTLRDGAQSLWAARLNIDAMLPTVADIDAAGFDGVEFLQPGLFARHVKDLRENPWDWLKLGVPLARRTQLRLHGGGTPYFARAVPSSVRGVLLDRVVELGITTTRISDPWNDPDALGEERDRLASHGIKSVVNLIYSVSPRHTTDYYENRAKAIAALKPYRICFKDVGGLLTPERTRELIPVVLHAAGDVPVEFHAHSNNGMAPLNYVIAAELGVTIFHTAIPPLASGTSQPSIFGTVQNLEALGFTAAIDLAPLERVRDHLSYVASVTGMPEGSPTDFDQSLYTHQVPGGMIAHLAFQLQQLGMAHRLPEVLAEVARVRAEFGYPIMVTPLSQVVGSQAAINVATGKRYGTVTDDVIEYALGRRGREAVDVMDPGIREQILDRPRAAELAARRPPPEVGLDEVRQRLGASITDEELILRLYVGDEAGRVYSPAPRAYTATYDEYRRVYPRGSGLAELATAVANNPEISRFFLSLGDSSLTIVR